MKKIKDYLIAFITPVIILLIVLLLNGYYPFGDNSILMLDGYNQYPGFLSLYTDILKGNANIFYSFNGSLGFSLFPNIVYYLISPTNLLAIFFNNTNLEIFYLITILLKIGLISVTTLKLLNYYKKTTFNIFIALCFALSTYNLLYYSNYMWFDSIILLPLIILGIHKIIDNNRYDLYAITLSLAIISNFYIAYMICIFSVIYFFYQYLLVKQKNKKQILNFFLTSILAGLIATIFIYPTAIELLNGKSELYADNVSKYLQFDFDFINFFYKSTIASMVNGDIKFGNPNIYVSLFIMLNSILFFFNKKISKKEKIYTIIIYGFFLLSMSFNLLDYGWQMFQEPIFYPVRYGFIIDIFLLIIATKNYYNLEISNKGYIITGILYLILILIGFNTSGNYQDELNITAKYIYLGINILIIIYYLFMHRFAEFRKYIWLIIIIELTANAFLTFKNYSKDVKVSTYEEKFNINYSNLEKINNNQIRISTSTPAISNNPLLLNYKGISYFSSIRNKKVFDFFKSLGMPVHDGCSVRYYLNNPVITNLLGIKYYITNDNIDYYQKIDNNIYQNQDNASLTYIFDRDIVNIQLEDDPITNLNKIMKYFINEDNSFQEYEQVDGSVHCSKNYCSYITLKGEKDYITWKIKPNEKSFIIVNTTEVLSNLDYEISIDNKIIQKNNYTPIIVKPNEEIKITLYIKDIDKETFSTEYFKVYSLSYNAYQKFNNKLNNQATIIEMKDNYLKIEVNNPEENKILYTSITNDNGWKAYINSKETNITEIFDSLIGIELEQGNNIIELKYHTPGLKTGALISIISLIIQIIYQIHLKNRYYQK